LEGRGKRRGGGDIVTNNNKQQTTTNKQNMVITLFINGSDVGKAEGGTNPRGLKQKNVPLPEGYDNVPSNDVLPESIKEIARRYKAPLIIKSSRFGRKPGQFYIKGDANTEHVIMGDLLWQNKVSGLYPRPKVWMSFDRAW